MADASGQLIDMNMYGPGLGGQCIPGRMCWRGEGWSRDRRCDDGTSRFDEEADHGGPATLPILARRAQESARSPDPDEM